jgi:hypothetical protein
MVSWALLEGRSRAEAKGAVRVLLLPDSLADSQPAGSQPVDNQPSAASEELPTVSTVGRQSGQKTRTLFAFSRLGSIALPLDASSLQALLGVTTGLGERRQDAVGAVMRLAVRARLAHVAELAGARVASIPPVSHRGAHMCLLSAYQPFPRVSVPQVSVPSCATCATRSAVVSPQQVCATPSRQQSLRTTTA